MERRTSYAAFCFRVVVVNLWSLPRQDKSISNSHVVLDLIDAIVPGSIDYALVSEGNDDEEKLDNAKWVVY